MNSPSSSAPSDSVVSTPKPPSKRPDIRPSKSFQIKNQRQNSATVLLKKENDVSFLSVFPAAFLGLALGLSGCGKAWKLMLDSFNYHNDIISGVEGAFETLALAILFTYMLKIVLYGKEVLKELSLVETQAGACAMTMSAASIASFYAKFFPTLCLTVWWTCLVGHILMAIWNFKIRWELFKKLTQSGKSFIEGIYCPIALPTVGIAMMAATSGSFGVLEHEIGFALFWNAAVFCVILQPLLAYRMFCVDEKTLNPTLMPTFFIYNAPVALVSATYFNLGHPSKEVSIFLFCFQLLSTFLFLFFAPKIWGTRFTPVWSAATFPTIVSAMSCIGFAIQMDGENHLIMIFSFCFLSLASIAVLVIMALAGIWMWHKLDDEGLVPISPPTSPQQILSPPISPRAQGKLGGFIELM